jgi:multisubunit Na+/H+ antiporter MnhB subunit
MLEAFDLLLAGAVVVVAWRALADRDVVRGVVTYVVFGLLMALAWVRLAAPDIALAEAAIGAGITGALLLEAAAGRPPETDGEGRPPARRAAMRATGLLAAGLLVALALAVLAVPAGVSTLAATVDARLDESGVTHPPTAVLLNFRGYDTLLEVGVLLVAALAVVALARTDDLRKEEPLLPSDPLLTWFARAAVPVAILVAAYVLWLGTHAPGGAFQSGAVLGAAAILLWLSGYRLAPFLHGRRLRALLVSGFALMLGIALATAVAGAALLEYPRDRAGTLILLVEAGIAVAVAATLAALYAVAARRHEREAESP